MNHTKILLIQLRIHCQVFLSRQLISQSQPTNRAIPILLNPFHRTPFMEYVITLRHHYYVVPKPIVLIANRTLIVLILLL